MENKTELPNEVKIDDKVYVLKESIKEREIGVMDSANVSLFVRIDTSWRTGDEFIQLPKPKMLFKCNGTINECTLDFGKTGIKTKNNTKIGYDIYLIACRLINAIRLEKTNKPLEFSVYEGWNETEKVFKKDFPVLLEYCDYGVLIAPRVDG